VPIIVIRSQRRTPQADHYSNPDQLQKNSRVLQHNPPKSDLIAASHEVALWAMSDKAHLGKMPTGEPRNLKRICHIKYMIENKIPFDAAMTLH
jgi:hypothetical protein